MSETPEGSNPEQSLNAAQADAPEVDHAAAMPTLTRWAIDIPPLKNHQDFQRACVVLYREELNDPHAQEYGRNGQAQRGLDIIGYRDGNRAHPVAIQCRRVAVPLKKAKIGSDCRQALVLEPALREIIFATTAPDATQATDAARAVEAELADEGFSVRVVVYGWGQMQTVIGLHPKAHAVFAPGSAITAVGVKGEADSSASRDVDDLAQALFARLKSSGAVVQMQDITRKDWHREDEALHAKIDTYRDLFKHDQQIGAAQKGLNDLRASAVGKPWALFRIETNLGSIAIDLGREVEAAALFEAACALRPDDADALANLALARTIQGRFDEAMRLASKALEAVPRSEAALAYLLQAAARCAWEGDPETLIPLDLKESLPAALGLAEFYRRRSASGWPRLVIALADRHEDARELQRLKAIAVLSLVLATDGAAAGAKSAVDKDQIDWAADFLKRQCEGQIEAGFADPRELAAYLNNAAILLRLSDRQADCETLLLRGLVLAGNDSNLRRLLALSQVGQDRTVDAIATLAGDDALESRMLRAQMLLFTDPATALAEARALNFPDEAPHLNLMRWRMAAEIGFRTRDSATVREAIGKISLLPGCQQIADLLAVQLAKREGESEDDVGSRLEELAAAVGSDSDFLFCYELAEELADADKPGLAADLLASRVDIARTAAPTILYLRTLLLAHREAEFRAALENAPTAVQTDPNLLWAQAAHYWNIGDLAKSLDALNAMIAEYPDHGRANVLRLHVLMRQGRSAEVLETIERAVETWKLDRLEDGLSLARMLAHFGEYERGAALAYRLFLSNRDASPAWMALSSIVIDEGRGIRGNQPKWQIDNVAADAAIDVAFDDGEKGSYVVEADPALRALDPASVEPDHPLVRQIWGATVGDEFETADGRTGTIRALRHKYVAQFHYVVSHHEKRFPDVAGFRRVKIDPSSPNGLQDVTETAKARAEFVAEQQRVWEKRSIPLALLAHRVGSDTIDAAFGVVGTGRLLHVASGNETQRRRAIEEIAANRRSGCTLELHSFWTAWRLKAVDTLVALCGQMHVAQSVLDTLRLRRMEYEEHSVHGHRSAGYDDGQLVFQQTSPDVMREIRDDTQAAIDWLVANAAIMPLELPAHARDVLVDHLQQMPPGVLDAAFVAARTNTLLISDDEFIRQYHDAITGREGAWTQIALQEASARGLMTFDDYTRSAAHLIDAGHGYVGTNARVLACAARLDHAAGTAPGTLFRTHASTIGGPDAEPRSHVSVVRDFLQTLWLDGSAIAYCEPVTGALLERLISQREDYLILIGAILAITRDTPLGDYVIDWLQGHFIPLARVEAAIADARTRTAKHRRKRTAARG